MTQAQRQLACGRLAEACRLVLQAEALMADVAIATNDLRHHDLTMVTVYDVRSLRRQMSTLETYLTPAA